MGTEWKIGVAMVDSMGDPLHNVMHSMETKLVMRWNNLCYTGKDCHIDHCHKTTFRHNGDQQGSRGGAGNKNSLPKDTRIHEIESGSECDSECSTTSDHEEHLEEEAEPTPVSSKN